MNDLRNVLTGLSGSVDQNTQLAENDSVHLDTQQKSNSSQSTSTSNKESFQYGEHLACVWYDDNKN